MKRTISWPKLLLLLIIITAMVLPVHAVFSAIANSDKVKLFSEPSPNAAVVEVLKKGDVVKVLEKSDDGQFWEVEHKGQHGWIISHQLSPRDYRN